ncbi:PadR family transcriptional regulator [Blastomonas sp.]|uniref:PadR family transcriptional regulator n=1 Tax=Blastomonas sp. TaxID=1909299 RepID=UPI0026172758|nr:PadR family transcriptional regulator [Blastomonas sp.]MDM7955160.1 PadR family transcriptional regulator [Blastomonas sp.]
MARRKNISKQTGAVLTALLERPSDWHHGYDLMEKAGIASGTLYPMLMRLCDQGSLESQWVSSPHEGRPARHAYRLTAAGLRMARDVLAPDASATTNMQGFAV